VFAIDFRRWFDRMQPQTLQIATWLLYFDAFFGLITLIDGSGYQGFLVRRHTLGFPILLFVVASFAFGGLLMANERRIGYRLAIFAAFSPFLLRIWALRSAVSALNFGGEVSLLDYFTGKPFGVSTLTLVFDIALIALLLHGQSRSHARIWFR
jgi:hypothetical protein